MQAAAAIPDAFAAGTVLETRVVACTNTRTATIPICGSVFWTVDESVRKQIDRVRVRKAHDGEHLMSNDGK